MRAASFLRPALVAAALGLGACSGARPVAPAGPVTAGPAHPAYETFDPTAHPAVAPPAAPTEHDVPARVMSGRVNLPGRTTALPAEDTSRQVEGHRVQIFSTASRETADRIRGEAMAWWASTPRGPGAPRTMDVQVVYLQPYYRVRMGGFTDEEEADRVLDLVRTRYPEAFLVPDLITVGD